MNRINQLVSVKSTDKWDVVVIGGGATGLGTALEAVSRGYKMLLLEQSDFSKSTSSKSTKLVHGGVRYLAQGYVDLVREACRERGLLLKNAPHLTRNVSFVIPLYSVLDVLMYTIGLKFYDLLAGKLSLGKSKFISKAKTLEMIPSIKVKGLRGGVLYHDGQFDDSRLAINLAQTIVEKGGTVLNYARVCGLKKNAVGKVSGVDFKDVLSGATYTVSAEAVVNATGVFADDINKMDLGRDVKTISPSQGVHVVIDRKFCPSENAIMIPKTDDGRVLFAVPWHNKIVLGTTDTPVKTESLEPEALEQEIDFIITTAGRYLSTKPQRKDVLSVFTGLRPLAASNDTEGSGKTKEISRSHKIIVSKSNLFSIIGGKWTTYRKMGEDLVSRMEQVLGWERTRTRTQHLAIHGYKEGVLQSDPMYYYGSDKEKINELGKKVEGGEQWLSEKLLIKKAQLVWAVRNEMAEKVEDFLSRRTRAMLLDVDESVRMAPEVARIMAAEKGRNESWVAAEIEEFRELAKKYVC